MKYATRRRRFSISCLFALSIARGASTHASLGGAASLLCGAFLRDQMAQAAIPKRKAKISSPTRRRRYGETRRNLGGGGQSIVSNSSGSAGGLNDRLCAAE